MYLSKALQVWARGEEKRNRKNLSTSKCSNSYFYWKSNYLNRLTAKHVVEAACARTGILSHFTRIKKVAQGQKVSIPGLLLLVYSTY